MSVGTEDRHALAVALRRQGLTYNEIADMLRLSKGTLSLWLRGVVLDAAAEARIAARVAANGQRLCAGLSDEQRRKGGKTAQQRHGQRLALQKMGRSPKAAVLAYRHDEIDAKMALEARYGCEFRKERIGARVRMDGQRYWLGMFKTPEEAARVVSEWRRKNMPYAVED